MAEAIRKDLSTVWQNSKLPGGANATLILARYLPVDIKDDKSTDAKKSLYLAMREALLLSAKPYESAFNRYATSFGTSCSCGDFKTAGRMVIGLGNTNVLETGLMLHHTYGTPLIPGTALKGLSSHYCDQVWGKANGGEEYRKGGKYHEAIFGTDEDSGHIIFHDAWITPGTVTDSLRDDIMTPHHKDYYSGDAAPTDFDDPNPILFLSIRGTFHVVVSCDVPGVEGENWAKLVFGMLSEALKEWGIGGKTSAGYGRLTIAGKASPANPTEERGANPLPQDQCRFSVGETIDVIREPDPRGRGRPYFKAEDGTGGFVRTPTDPSITAVPLGKETRLTILGILTPPAYDFGIPVQPGQQNLQQTKTPQTKKW